MPDLTGLPNCIHGNEGEKNRKKKRPGPGLFFLVVWILMHAAAWADDHDEVRHL